MKKSFFQRLQKVKLMDILHIFLFLIAIIPAFIYKKTHQPFWLICDYENEARDNGYYFYKYMIEKHKDKNVIYAINKKSPDFKKVKNLGKVVNYGTLLHWIYYLSADVNISSQKGGKPNAAVCYLLEVYGPLKNKRVFLQHGIIKDNLPYVHYNNAKFSMFTVSTKQEYDYVSNNFGYPNGIIKQVGLCRFDDLKDTSTGEFILVMPTWRQWISNGDFKTKNIEDISEFKNTDYYKSWATFLQSKELNELLRKYNKKLIFYPHRNMQQFIDNFKHIENEHIIIASWPTYDVHELLKSCNLLITDYSSVAMDFAYLNKPIIYYQFDYDVFRANHLEEGYFNYEKDAFGPICYNQEELFLNIENELTYDFQVNQIYQERINTFFDLRDSNNCERTFNAIQSL